MNALEILARLEAAEISAEEALRQLVGMGVPEDDAAFQVDIATGQSSGDLVDLNNPASEPSN